MRALPKACIISFVLAAACFSMAAPASAVSLQLRGGTSNGDPGNGSNFGLDVFFYEGRSFDFFVGYDRISLSDRHDLWVNTTTVVSATTDAAIDALTLAFRYKMQTESSWKPFLSLGIVRLATKFTHQPGYEYLYERPFDQSSTGMRLGLGVDVGISDNWSVGLEGDLITGVPYYEDAFFGTGRMLDSYGVMTQLNIGLRYHFD